MNFPVLYEINTRCWLRRLSEERGKVVSLSSVPEAEIDEWQQLGFTHIWAMGVWRTGPLARAHALENRFLHKHLTRVVPGWKEEDVGASPYAVTRYEAAEEMGGNDGLQAFRAQLHARGMKLLLDFVPNHVGLDHPWINESPEFFVQSTGPAPGFFERVTKSGTRWIAHGKDPYFPPWGDTAQLDYRRAETRAVMIGTLKSIATQCDGVRCDMAMLLLNEVFNKTWSHLPIDEPSPAMEFWSEAIDAVRRERPDFIFLAEAYWGLESKLQQLGFDFTYDKMVYDRLVERNHHQLQKQLFSEPRDVLARGVHFLENHDEGRAASVFSFEEHRAAALLVLGLPGMRMIYEGQLRGGRLQTPVHLLRWPDEPMDCRIAAMYGQLLGAIKNSAVGHGECQLLMPEHVHGDFNSENVIVIELQVKPDQADLVIVNLGSQPARCTITPAISEVPSQTFGITDLIETTNGDLHPVLFEQHKLHLDLSPHAAHLLRIQRM